MSFLANVVLIVFVIVVFAIASLSLGRYAFDDEFGNHVPCLPFLYKFIMSSYNHLSDSGSVLHYPAQFVAQQSTLLDQNAIYDKFCNRLCNLSFL
jgi:hypothetical protein